MPIKKIFSSDPSFSPILQESNFLFIFVNPAFELQHLQLVAFGIFQLANCPAIRIFHNDAPLNFRMT